MTIVHHDSAASNPEDTGEHAAPIDQRSRIVSGFTYRMVCLLPWHSSSPACGVP